MHKFAALLALVLLAGVSTFAMGERDGPSDRGSSKPQNVEVSGKVRLVGNSPMTSLVLSGEDREWYIEPDEQDKLMHLQQQTVTVKAREYYLDRVFANGRPAGRYYFLKDIVIITPER